jgi:hypothetical protein
MWTGGAKIAERALDPPNLTLGWRVTIRAVT